MVALPRLVVSASSTGQGKTTIATGLMAALRAAGHEVSGHKVGPDYIDPGYHALATGRPGRNLDPHLVGEERIVPLLLHGAVGAGIAVIEGVMGLYDGRLGTAGFASTAHVATLTRSPVVLVVDVAGLSRTAAAIAAGLAAFDPGVQIAGVILNRTGSPRNDAEIVAAMEGVGLPVLGQLPRQDELVTPSRHLGLVPATEREESTALIRQLGEQVAQHLDLDALLDVARGAPDLDGEAWTPSAEVHPPTTGRSGPCGEPERRPVIAVAGGRAFTFRYPEAEELLHAAGCDVVTFDPIGDPCLPAGTRGVYLGGGFPEVYAAELAANRRLLADLRAAADAGVPVVAECAGLLYLAETLDGAPMSGILPVTAAMSQRLTLRYPVATASADSLLTRAGEQVTGHEFHRTQTTPASGHSPAWEIDGATTGFATESLHASYLHVHWAGHPRLAQRFADAAHAAPSHAAPSHQPAETAPGAVTHASPSGPAH
ncbi:MAG: cobyrinate a,c-diamide synthase [Nocardioidaceae bacterium]